MGKLELLKIVDAMEKTVCVKIVKCVSAIQTFDKDESDSARLRELGRAGALETVMMRNKSS